MTRLERETSPDYAIEPFAESRYGEQDVLDLWERERVLVPEGPEKRLPEVLMVGSHADDGLVGISSAYLQRNRQLGMTLWHFRVFVAGEHRWSNLAARLASAARDHVGDRFTSGEDRRGQGMIFEVENEGLKRAKNLAVWRHTDFVFIGVREEDGAHLRVFYFPGALAPDPPAP
ncbi:MAG TPA: hypothetical protein VKA89_03760 [Solirubrobacterales bacterium]|nr:hypothetical protein [Solirubrobacterales bacterium]